MLHTTTKHRTMAAWGSLLVVGSLAAACGGGSPDAPPSTGGAGGDATGGDQVGGGADEVSVGCVAPDEPTYQPYSDNIPQVPLCDDPDVVPLPVEAKLVDLGQVSTGSVGTCGPFARFEETPIELDASIGFPQALRLPALAGADPMCTELCSSEIEPTAFGLTVVYPGLSGDDRFVAVRVPAPWYLVIGNEHSPTPCLDGSPSALEFGKPLACATTWGNHLGFATGDPNAPSVDVIIDLLEPEMLPNTPMCCAYTCP